MATSVKRDKTDQSGIFSALGETMIPLLSA
jgi:hypothetical protein